MAKRLISLAGKVLRRPASELDADRYQYLSLEQAEPNPGNPDSNNSIFVSNADGTRKFVREPELGGLSFTNDRLPNYDDFVVDGNYALILNNDPNSHSGADSVGYRQLASSAFSLPTLEQVTTQGNETTQGIDLVGGALTLDADASLSALGDVTINGGTGKNLIVDGPQLFYSAPALIDNTLLTIGSNDSVGQREALFAFVAPTLRQTTDQSLASGDAGSTPKKGAVTTSGINAPFFSFNSAPPGRASVDARTALVYTGLDDSIGTRSLRDLAVQDSTTFSIGANRLKLPGTSVKTFVSGDTVRMMVFDSVGTIPPNGNIKNVQYADFDYDDLLGNDETLHTVTARTEPGFATGETGNLAIFSGGINFTSPPAGNTFSAVFRGTVADADALGVRTLTELALLDSTTANITTHGLTVKYNSLDVQTTASLDSTTVDGPLVVNDLFTATDGAVVNTLQVSDLTNQRVLIAGASGEVTDDADLTFDGDTLTSKNLNVSINFDVDGATTLDSTTIDAGIAGSAIKMVNLAQTAIESTAVMIEDDGTIKQRTLAASAFSDPTLQLVTDQGDSTTARITTNGIITTGYSEFGDSVVFKDSTTIEGAFLLPNIESTNSLRVLVKNTTTNEIGFQDISQEAITGETLHSVTSQGKTTSNDIGVQAVYIYDKTGFADNNQFSGNYNVVIDSDRDIHVQDKIFFNDLSGTADQHFLDPKFQGDRNYIRFTDPAFAGYPGIYDFISDDSDKIEAVGNSLIRAGGLILTDSATVGTNLTITGNLTVNGTTTYVNTETLNVNDKNIVIAYGEVTETNTANAGIKIADSVNPFASFLYDGAGSWVVDVNLTVDSDLTVSGATNLNAAATAGVFLSGAQNLSTETTGLFLGENDSVGFRNFEDGAFTQISSLSWDRVLGFGDSTGPHQPFIKSGFRVDSAGLVSDPTNLRVMTLVSDGLPASLGGRDSVGVRTLGTAANLSQNDITLDFVLNKGNTSSNGVTIGTLEITNPPDFDNVPYAAQNIQNALFIASNDSVGFRDLGNLAFLDSDAETLASLTSKGPKDNTVVATDLSFPNLALTSLSSAAVDIAVMLDGDDLVTRQLSSSAFTPQDLQDVTETGANRHFGGHRDSTNIAVVLDGGLSLNAPLTAQAALEAAPTSDFYQMLIINTNTDSVRRGNIPTIIQTTSDLNLQEVMNIGAALNADGLNRDSTTVSPVFANTIFYPGIDKTESTSDFLIVYDSVNQSLDRRSLSAILGGVSLHDVTTVGRTTSNAIGSKEFRIWDGNSFADDDNLANFDLVIDENRNAFFANLDATGLTTLDSTTIDGQLRVGINSGSATQITSDGIPTLQVSDATSNAILQLHRQDVGILSNDQLGAVQFSATDLGVNRTGAQITAKASTNWNSGSEQAGTRLGFWTRGNQTGYASLYEKMRIGAGDSEGIDVFSDLNVDGKLVVADGNTFPQTEDRLYIGGSGLDGEDASIYLGNHGGGTGYGWRFFYQGTGSANLNKLIIRSENLGSPVDALSFTQDGAAVFDNTVTAANLETSGNLNVDGLTTLDSTTIDGTLTVNDSANITGRLSVLYPFDYPITLQSTGRFAGIEFIDVFGTGRFVWDGLESKFTTQSNLEVGGLTTLDSTTVDGSLTVQTDKLQLQSGVQLQDAAGTNLVIYDSADAVLWGNV